MHACGKERRLETLRRLRVVEKRDAAEEPRKRTREEDLSYADLIEKLVAEELQLRLDPKRPPGDGD